MRHKTIKYLAIAGISALATIFLWVGCEAPGKGPRIEGYGDFMLGASASTVIEERDQYSFSEDGYTYGVDMYEVTDEFVTKERVTTVRLRILVRDDVIQGIEIEFHFTRPLTNIFDPNRFFGPVNYDWSPGTSLIGEVRQMVRDKYQEMVVTHDHFTMGPEDQCPAVKLIIRDEESNAISVTWESEPTDGYLYVRYATSEFFDEIWNVGEEQEQIDRL